MPWENRFGIVGGIERIGDVYYLGFTPQINYSREVLELPFSMSFGAPVRLEVHDTRPYNGKTGAESAGGGFKHIARFRSADWDEPADFAQLIRGVQWGGKEGHFYLDVNAFKASSIGHGALLKRYNPNLNLNRRRVSAQFDAFGDYFGGETFVNDITGPNVVGALGFVKPLSLINRDNYLMRSFSLGLAFAADLAAPLRNLIDYNDLDNDGRREGEFAIDQKTFQPKTTDTQVFAFGADAEIKLIDTQTTDWKTYLDYSMLASGLPVDRDAKVWDDGKMGATKGVQSAGLTWGNLLRLNVGDTTRQALRLRGELRRYDHNYLPGYFDVLYEVQRVQYKLGAGGRPNPTGTKLMEVLSRKGTGQVFGAYFEASWLVQDLLALAFAVEVNNETPDNNFFLHFELPHLRSFQFLATLHRRSAPSAGNLFAFDFTSRDILIVKGRYRVSDILHINVEALTPFGIGPDSYFNNTIDFNINAELGFSYGRKG
ncbi:MAG: hypothetical protein EXR79_02505 [Myxococcales bacterium]|nr:hypothetical protein [Myxococcales bacterium]